MRSPFLRKTRARLTALEVAISELEDRVGAIPGIPIFQPKIIDRRAPSTLTITSDGMAEVQVQQGYKVVLAVAAVGEHGTPGGAVTLFDNGKELSGTTKMLDSGSCEYGLTYPTAGRHQITASFSGNETYLPQPPDTTIGLVVSVV